MTAGKYAIGPLRVGCILALGVLPFNAASADDAIAQEGISDRLPYQAPGIGLGSFDLYGSVTGRAYYDSNVFAQSFIHASDYVFLVKPDLILQSNWARNDLRLEAGAATKYYNKFDSENHTDWNIQADGRLDITQPLRFVGSGGYQIQHEDRSSPDQPRDAASPTRYQLLPFSGDLDYLGFRFGVKAGVTYSHIQWDDTLRVDTTPLDNRDRNLDELSYKLEFLYEISPGYSVFIRGTHTDRTYEQKIDRFGEQRDSKGNNADLGIQFELTRLLTGEAFVGYQKFDLTNSSLPGAKGLDYGATLTWYPTTTTTVTFNASKSFDASTLIGVGGVSANQFSLGVGYQLLRNFTVSGDLSYILSVFEGGAKRMDSDFVGDVEGTYYLNQYAQAGLRYEYHERTSELSINSYTENRIGLFVKFQR